MENILDKDINCNCGNEECSCNNDEKPVVAVKRNVHINFDTNSDCENPLSQEDCECENTRKALAILGASAVAIGVAGGILYLVKRRK